MKAIKKLKLKIRSLLVGASNKKSKKIIRYFVPGDNWSTNYDGVQIMSHLPNQGGEVTSSHLGINQGIFHLGGIAHSVNKNKIKWPNPDIPCIVTWHHVLNNDPRLDLVPSMDERVAFWHSTCQKTLNTLIAHGADINKTRLIPLGVDTEAFKPIDNKQKDALKKQYGIPKDAIVIGSFQKDSIGWKDGVKPKLEKGPDIFCDVIERIAKKNKIFILLSGPARGYVKERLKASNIEYYHTGYLENTEDTAPFFQILDIYLIASRIEGGPKAVLESAACQIPLVTTNVGLVSDLMTHEQNALIADIEDVDTLTCYVQNLIDNQHLRSEIAKNALKIAQNHSWEIISRRYYHELYLPLLNEQKI